MIPLFTKLDTRFVTVREELNLDIIMTAELQCTEWVTNKFRYISQPRQNHCDLTAIKLQSSKLCM